MLWSVSPTVRRESRDTQRQRQPNQPKPPQGPAKTKTTRQAQHQAQQTANHQPQQPAKEGRSAQPAQETTGTNPPKTEPSPRQAANRRKRDPPDQPPTPRKSETCRTWRCRARRPGETGRQFSLNLAHDACASVSPSPRVPKARRGVLGTQPGAVGAGGPQRRLRRPKAGVGKESSRRCPAVLGGPCGGGHAGMQVTTGQGSPQRPTRPRPCTRPRRRS